MVIYSCEKCGKQFPTKSQYNSHNKRKTPCIKQEIPQIKQKEVKQEIPQIKQEVLEVKQDGNKLKVISVFSGCGGLDFAFHKKSNQFEIVYVNDFDEDSCNSYEKYYNYKPICGDIKKINTFPDCDILIGGFPCQGFSIANIYRNEKDSRNKLYLELVRILQLKKPKYFIFENVKGILSLGGYETTTDKKNKNGKVFKVILSDLEKCGYIVYTKLFKLKWYDIPQNRERVIFIGIRNDISNKINFTWPEEKQEITKTLKDAIGDLPIEYDENIQHIGTKYKVNITGYIGNRELYWNRVSPTITGRGTDSGGPVINIHPSGKRRMTVREYARIQTFPDDFHFSGSISSMYRQIGNSVPPKFSFVLAELIYNINSQIIDIWNPWTDKSKNILFKSNKNCIGNGEEKLAKEMDIIEPFGSQNKTFDLIHPTIGKISVKDMTNDDCTLGAECTKMIRSLFRKVVYPLSTWSEKYQYTCEYAKEILHKLQCCYGNSKNSIFDGIERFELSHSNFTMLNNILEDIKQKKFTSMKSEYIIDICEYLKESTLQEKANDCVRKEAIDLTLIIVNEKNGWMIVKDINRITCPQITRGSPKIRYS